MAMGTADLVLVPVLPDRQSVVEGIRASKHVSSFAKGVATRDTVPACPVPVDAKGLGGASPLGRHRVDRPSGPRAAPVGSQRLQEVHGIRDRPNERSDRGPGQRHHRGAHRHGGRSISPILRGSIMAFKAKPIPPDESGAAGDCRPCSRRERPVAHHAAAVSACADGERQDGSLCCSTDCAREFQGNDPVR